jgi:hypothetical protein
MEAGESGSKAEEVPTPSTCLEALRGEHSAEWVESMAKELAGLQKTGTYEWVPRPKDRKVVPHKWVYRVKRTSTGAAFFKSRLVAKGFAQVKGLDYSETWAPTAKQTTARILFHLAAVLNLELDAMDVDQAFLNGELEEEVYMEPPYEVVGGTKDQVWRLRKALYGLKQAPRQWHAKLKEVLLGMGFQPSIADPSLFLKRSTTSEWIWSMWMTSSSLPQIVACFRP